MKFLYFPIRNKIPLIKEWQDKATDDPAQLELWRQQYATQLTHWGIITGPRSGLYVLDIDRKPDADGYASLAAQGILDSLTGLPSQVTPSGGKHVFFRYPGDAPGIYYGNTSGKIRGIDTRGSGGYVVFYGLSTGSDLTKITDVPEWLANLGRKSEKNDSDRAGNSIRISDPIAQGIMAGILDTIRNAPSGESNNTLNTQAYLAGQLVAGGFSEDLAKAQLMEAARVRGKPEREARATIDSGLRAGMEAPILSPFGDAVPSPLFEIPPVPGFTNERWTPRGLTLADFTATQYLKKPQLFRDWSSEDIEIITADGGTGKTTMELCEAVCLALGDRFLGFECKAPGGRTLYITGEDTEQKLAAMLGQILKQMGLLEGPNADPHKMEIVRQSIVIKKDSDLCLISKDKQGFIHMNKDAMNKVLEAVHDFKPKMIIFDPIASFWGSESALNDMNKAVTKFMARLVEESGACVKMINHMGKSSSQNKDMSQFAGRGGTGLPSNSRVSKVLRTVDTAEYREMTGQDLDEGKTAILCQINKFSDGSAFYNKPFLIIREGYLFTRQLLTDAKVKEIENKRSEQERIIHFVREARQTGKFPTLSVLCGFFSTSSEPIPMTNTKRAVSMLQFQGYMGEKLKQIEHPDGSIKEKALVVIDETTGEEII